VPERWVDMESIKKACLATKHWHDFEDLTGELLYRSVGRAQKKETRGERGVVHGEKNVSALTV